MARVSITTFYYTALLGLLYTISKGWHITSFQISRDDSTSITMVLATSYLAYSAYFLSSDFQGISYIVKFIMAGIYIAHSIINLRNIKKCSISLKRIIQRINRDN